jgi:hypothetical protein
VTQGDTDRETTPHRLSDLNESERDRRFARLQEPMPAVWDAMRLAPEDGSVVRSSAVQAAALPSVTLDPPVPGSASPAQAFEERNARRAAAHRRSDRQAERRRVGTGDALVDLRISPTSVTRIVAPRWRNASARCSSSRQPPRWRQTRRSSTAVGPSPEKAMRIYEKAQQVLFAEAAAAHEESRLPG